jgi:hypothetical protein
MDSEGSFFQEVVGISAIGQGGAPAKQCRINDRPQMNDPAKQKKPENTRKDEVNQSHANASLHELSQTRDEKTTDGGKHITCRTWSCHDAVLLGRRQREEKKAVQIILIYHIDQRKLA